MQRLRLRNLSVFFISFAFCILHVACGNSDQNPNESNAGLSSSGDSLSLIESIESRGIISIGFEPDAPPLYYHKDDSAQGFDLELVKFWVNDIFPGVKINIVEAGYDELPELLRKGQIDLIAGGRTNDNDTNEIYTDSYLSFGYSLIANRKDRARYTDLKSIANVRIGVFDDFAKDWVQKRLPNANIKVSGNKENIRTSASDWMSELAEGNLDVIIYDYPFTVNEIKDYRNDLVVTNFNLNPDKLNEYVFVANRNASEVMDLIDKINKSIKTYKTTKFFSQAITKYLPSTEIESISKPSLKDSYIVKPGETVYTIARDYLGDVNRWPEIYKMNNKLLASPDIIYPGQQIAKPTLWLAHQQKK